MTEQIDLADPLVLPAGDLGGPGRFDPAYCSAWAMKTLQAEAGDGMNLASFSLELGSVEAGLADVVAVYLATDKRTHAVAFLSLEALSGATVAFTARAVFSVR